MTFRSHCSLDVAYFPLVFFCLVLSPFRFAVRQPKKVSFPASFSPRALVECVEFYRRSGKICFVNFSFSLSRSTLLWR